MADDGRNTSGQRAVLAATILGSSLTFIDGAVVNVSLPAIGAQLGASFSALQWVVSGYMLTLASLMLAAGALGDRWGHAVAFSRGLVLFGLASLLCALAPGVEVLIGARLAQGAAAALLVPASLALIADHFSGAARGRAIGIWAAASAMTTAIAPLIGGFMIDSLGWPSVFLINLPLAAGAWWLLRAAPPQPQSSQPPRADLAGAALATLSLGLISFGLIALGEGAGWRGGGALIAGLIVLVGFALQQVRSADPMIPPSMFRIRLFAGANLLTVLLYAAFSGGLIMVPLVLIETSGFSAAAAGAALLPISILMGLFSASSGRLAQHIGPRLPLTVGPLLCAAGFAIMAGTGPSFGYAVGFLPGLIVLGLGMVLTVPPLTTSVLDAVPDTQSGRASSINNVAARTGGLLAVAALGLAVASGTGGGIAGPAVGAAMQRVMLAAALLSAGSALAGWWATGHAPPPRPASRGTGARPAAPAAPKAR
uniref:MFS transporter, DHA2 family n=1 Tax=Aureimonas frigidaquae TaxID=424757 RepID=A0A0P0Z326_9HYPH|nr:MFS transporter, DHA2 family [Aureimonas frigidaquae]